MGVGGEVALRSWRSALLCVCVCVCICVCVDFAQLPKGMGEGSGRGEGKAVIAKSSVNRGSPHWLFPSVKSLMFCPL